jgi:hypothetical protein
MDIYSTRRRYNTPICLVCRDHLEKKLAQMRSYIRRSTLTTTARARIHNQINSDHALLMRVYRGFCCNPRAHRKMKGTIPRPYQGGDY